ncbi:putative adhesin [Streptomyces sp. DH18]|uniref:putative adhesin n=1 Tax=Streptomyces sp. DH18 TaxID=3040126 RepID=UPI00301454F7
MTKTQASQLKADTPLSPPVHIYESGKYVRNYTLYPGPDLTMLKSSVTVDRPIHLGGLFQPNAGTCHWAACR